MPFLTGGNVFLGDVAADDLVLDRDALAAFLRHHVEYDVAELTATARLLGQLAVAFAGLGDGLAIGDLRRTGVGLDVELAAHAVHDDVEVQLAHAGDDRLAGFLVGLDREGRIFLDQAAEGLAHLFAIGPWSSARWPWR